MFNEKQKQIVEHINGPLLCIAGPGSGKTTSVIGRVINMVEKGINPENILVVTFTKAAADEMQERFEKKSDKTGVTFGTIHSICLKILKNYNSVFYNNECILEESKAQDFFSKIIDKRYIEKTEIESYVKSLMTAIGCIKNTQCLPEEVNVEGVTTEELKRCYKWYENWKNENHKIDFDDILIHTLDLFKTNEKVLNKWRKQYTHIIIDEYQDTNNLQAEIFYLLAKPKNNLCVVGDDDQSIYGFRGANPQVMLDFEKEFEGCKKVILDTNYRSETSIVEASKKLIENNNIRFKKELNAFKPEKGEIVVKNFATSMHQNKYLVEEIKSAHRTGISYDEMAVIFRTNSEANAIARLLVLHKIPIYTQDLITDVYKHWIFDDIKIFYKIALGTATMNEFRRVMNRPNNYLPHKLFTGEVSFENIYNCTTIIFEKWKREKAQENITKLFSTVEKAIKKNPYEFVKAVRYDLDYEEYLHEYAKLRNVDAESLTSILDIVEDEAKNISDFDSWFNFAKESSLRMKDELSRKLKDGAVALTTMHKSKGLEWNKVFIVNVNENVTPYFRAKTLKEVEEERRMFYVATTRAKHSLNIYYCNVKGKESIQPSRFISEILKKKPKKKTPEEFKRLKESIKYKTKSPSVVTYADLEKAKKNKTDFKEKEWVNHPTFGKGLIMKVDFEKAIITISFQNAGLKKFGLQWCNDNLGKL